MIYELRKTDDFLDWFYALKDGQGRSAIARRMRRAENGNFGKCKTIAGGHGLKEMVIDFGPGYRVYFAREGKTVYVIVAGGPKKTQTDNIEAAKAIWAAIKAGEYEAY